MNNLSLPLKLKFSHNIIEHLGLKLYQNKPSNVIAELLSNSWDADAEKVEIILDQEDADQAKRSIAVMDNGHGMDYETLRTQYLIIGKHKRTKQNASAVSPEKSRKFMGRKGIGKLAPFGISGKVTVITRHHDNSGSLVNWFVIDLLKLLDLKGNDDQRDGFEISYEPELVAQDCLPDKLPTNSESKNIVDAFIDFTNIKQSGTLILLQNLTLRRRIPEEQLVKSLGRRFTITLLQKDFVVSVNDRELLEKEALPTFDLRIPETGATTEVIVISGQEREVKHWVGFVDITKSDWPQDQAGVGVYAHGKIAQDRPYFFGIKGREIFTRYMYGVIEADWIDELSDDVVSTDRTSVDWEHDELVDLNSFGLDLVSKWINNYKNHTQSGRKKRVKSTLESLENLPKVSQGEQQVIIDMVAGMGARIDKNEEFQSKILSTVTSAWTHRPVRELVKGLWDHIDSSLSNEELVIEAIGQLNDYLVPESLSLAVTVSQRIYAISKLYQLKLVGNENQLQYLIEEFPWILSPDMAPLTANEAMTTMVKKATQQGLIPASRHMQTALKSDGNLRPDFVLFSDAGSITIKIVELKSPEIELDRWHRQQLGAYLDYIEEHYPKADLSGWLIGKNPEGLIAEDKRVVISTWDEVFQRSRLAHLHLLAAMINGAKDYADDARLADSIEFGGKETIEMLKRMTNVDADFSDLFERMEAKLSHRQKKT